MLSFPGRGEPLDRLGNRIQLTSAPSRALVDDIITTACPRFSSLKAAGKAGQFDEWCRSEAWIDAAGALVLLELPAWSVRRIVRDDNIWLCSLSRMPGLPAELDDIVEASHENLPLAILASLVEAKRQVSNAKTATRQSSSTGTTERHRICCDNF